ADGRFRIDAELGDGDALERSELDRSTQHARDLSHVRLRDRLLVIAADALRPRDELLARLELRRDVRQRVRRTLALIQRVGAEVPLSIDDHLLDGAQRGVETDVLAEVRGRRSARRHDFVHRTLLPQVLEWARLAPSIVSEKFVSPVCGAPTRHATVPLSWFFA